MRLQSDAQVSQRVYGRKQKLSTQRFFVDSQRPKVRYPTHTTCVAWSQFESAFRCSQAHRPRSTAHMRTRASHRLVTRRRTWKARPIQALGPRPSSDTASVQGRRSAKLRKCWRCTSYQQGSCSHLLTKASSRCPRREGAEEGLERAVLQAPAVLSPAQADILCQPG